MEKVVSGAPNFMLNGFLPLFSVVIGGILSYVTTSSIERQKIKKENENKKFETKLKMFQTLEFIEKKCEYYIMDYQNIGDYLDLEKFPTFHLIEINKLSYVKFLIKCDYNSEYEKFLKIEEKLKKRRKKIKGEIFAMDEGFYCDEREKAVELSSEIYTELNTIIEDIVKIKEKIKFSRTV